MEGLIREADHSGSWYSSNSKQLTAQLDGWLDSVPGDALADGPLPLPGARVIISPHAGYAYSGPTAAWAYKSLDLSKAKRIFVLHPSHHWHLRAAALPEVDAVRTPLSSDAMPLDLATIRELSALTANTGSQTIRFSRMSQSIDEAEHSAEMQYPFIHRLLQKLYPNQPVSSYPPLVPIMIGATNKQAERALGELLAPYIAQDSNAFVISSDFCHWGSRFSYTYYIADAPSPAISPLTLPNGVGGKAAALDVHKQHDWRQGRMIRGSVSPQEPRIHESVAEVDRACMCAIASGSYDDFIEVIEETGNTVCGRHPIGVFLAGLETLEKANSGIATEGAVQRGFRFVRYERSSDVVSAKDSSVSYVGAFAVL